MRPTQGGDQATGECMASRLDLPDRRPLSTASLKTAQVSVTRLSVAPAAADRAETVARMPPERSWIVSQPLDGLRHDEICKLGGLRLASSVWLGKTSCSQTEEALQPLASHDHDCLHYHIPQLALREIAGTEDFPVLDGLAADRPKVDPTAAAIGGSLLPAFANPETSSQAFVDHILIAFCAHLLAHYATKPGVAAGDRGEISGWQVRQAIEQLSADLARDVSLAEVAAVCGMPIATFTRGFRRTVGISPYRWRQRHRLETARQMLVEIDRPIAAIAYECGFADQSHFTHAFRAAFGTTPLRHRLDAGSTVKAGTGEAETPSRSEGPSRRSSR